VRNLPPWVGDDPHVDLVAYQQEVRRILVEIEREEVEKDGDRE
jgi:hypothetical protein